jgi:GxxExxY protein
VPSPLSDETEKLVHDTIGCCIAVHRALGPGHGEKVYAPALCLELKACGIAYERERRFEIKYRGQVVGALIVDIVVADQVVLELKSVELVADLHHKQILNYMRIAGIRAGLLVNFNVTLLPDGLNRKVL